MEPLIFPVPGGVQSLTEHVDQVGPRDRRGRDRRGV
jgi:hypothetical protein